VSGLLAAITWQDIILVAEFLAAITTWIVILAIYGRKKGG
jgi:hypothetical protein